VVIIINPVFQQKIPASPEKYYLWLDPERNMKNEILEAENLSVTFRNGNETVNAVGQVSFTLRKGKTLGIVGESGSGKSVTALAVMNLLPPNALLTGNLFLTNHDGTRTGLTALSRRQWQQIRGNRISMIFQEPMTSLNPVMRCGKQVTEAILAHQPVTRKQAREKTLELFREVLLADPEGAFTAYPHELSGGQRQRIMIAMALSSGPDILIADEPTTALDVTVQQSVILLLKSLQQKYNLAILFITHDLNLVKNIAGELLVMNKGRVVETGSVEEIFGRPKHPYTVELLNSGTLQKEAPIEIRETRVPVLQARGVTAVFRGKRKRKDVKAVDNVSLEVYAGEALGLVGESGCGKTTLGRTLLKLTEPDRGTILFGDQELNKLRKGTLKRFRKEVQIIFQDPYSSLNPKMTVGAALTEPMTVHGIGKTKRERREKAVSLLQKAGLDESFLSRYPHELSGGQRQRVCIARALSVEPRLIVCDESVSALDVTIRAQVLKLLKSLKEELGLTLIFISHDLSVVRYISDRIAVMKDGRIIELNHSEEIWRNPRSQFTKDLISAIPK